MFNDHFVDLKLVSIPALLEMMENRIFEKLSRISFDLKHVVQNVDRAIGNGSGQSYYQVRHECALDMPYGLASIGPQIESQYDNLRSARKSCLHVSSFSNRSKRKFKLGPLSSINFADKPLYHFMPNIQCTSRSPQVRHSCLFLRTPSHLAFIADLPHNYCLSLAGMHPPRRFHQFRKLPKVLSIATSLACPGLSSV